MEARKLDKMATMLLEMAADTFCNHGCNDLSPEFIKEAGLTDEEKVQFVTEYYEWNGDLEDAKKYGWIKASHFDHMGDSTLMRFIAHKLKASWEHGDSDENNG
jgi:hypothetical protein